MPPQRDELEASRREVGELKAERAERVVAANTEHLRSETALRGSEERFRELAENINEVFWVTDPVKHQMLYVSPAYERVWECSCESLYASPRTWFDRIHPDDVRRVQRAVEEKQAAGTFDEEFR